ncbi:hypothetical protein [Streptomyces acidiscabies]|uniref:Uncharacterized protein n=1 Tax=Streptomyces acidiscabies TaxID=42234 RepID=A0AAP6EI95_9ACTN|nr:hypothetical protein [Streptomyces acidiscabies]MBZ3915191.1 hypothetical protein [Streptomyces acidiscabies]MDX2963694.1 hypothetical protein [Streptomyces acidiscabies]MDX3021253.1 hypothetical protein [Streptomyces acidiscabies]MDX3793494.1 hypothetical protein [Streptomyces acidiscabies]GAQ54281.1 hypothetical protein a10_04088 [Streptomyces acidiscabies]
MTGLGQTEDGMLRAYPLRFEHTDKCGTGQGLWDAYRRAYGDGGTR